MIEDAEDFDELPPIIVNSSGRDSSRFSMPSAAEVAEQRARAERCERELRLLRRGGGVAAVAHSDSEGSEGEAALVAAAAALAVAGAARRPAPRLAALLPAQRPLLAEYARAAAALPPRAAARLAHRTLRRLGGAGVAGEEEAEARAAAAWLCLALAGVERAQLGSRVCRAAHAALARLPAAAAPALARSLAAALETARARVRLADALRGGGRVAGAVAGALTAEAEDEAQAARRWRRLAADERLCALATWGRARAHGSPASAACAARALRTAQPPRDHRLDSLKVQVAASKLQVLFPDKK